MKINECINRIIEWREKFSVVALHDYFIDHFIYMEEDLNGTIKDIIETAKRGGGNIFKNKQTIMRGGCAANFSAAIAKLGVKVKLITYANKIGLEILKRDAIGVDLSHVKECEEQAITTIIESTYMDRKVNIMISYPSILSNFGLRELNENDWEAILRAEFVCMFTWNVNNKGTELIDGVGRRVKECGRGSVYIDLGDPRHRIKELKELLDKIKKREIIDALSLNENELDIINKITLNEEKPPMKLEENLIKLSKELNVRLDVHTPKYSATATNDKVVVVPCFKVNVKRTTGAGDSWNAGNILGWGVKLDDYNRLLIANAVAAIYISKEHPCHPDIWELKNFITNMEQYNFNVS